MRKLDFLTEGLTTRRRSCLGLGCLINNEGGMGIKPSMVLMRSVCRGGSSPFSVKVDVSHIYSNLKQSVS